MANLTDVFRALNDLETDGVIQRYAIAGAMAFLFYTEPVRTYDRMYSSFYLRKKARLSQWNHYMVSCEGTAILSTQSMF